AGRADGVRAGGRPTGRVVALRAGPAADAGRPEPAPGASPAPPRAGGSERAEVGGHPAFRTHPDDDLVAVGLPGVVDVAVDLLGGQVAGGDLPQESDGGRGGVDDRPLDGDV